MFRLFTTTGICFGLFVAGSASSLNAFQQPVEVLSPSPVRAEAEIDSRIDFLLSSRRLALQRPSQTDYRTEPKFIAVAAKQPEQTTASDQPWFGTVMSFPAAPVTTASDQAWFGTVMTFPAALEKTVSGQAGSVMLQASAKRNLQPPFVAELTPKIVSESNFNPVVIQSPGGALTASVAGPAILVLGEHSAYEIEVSNPSDHSANDVIVQLQIPEYVMITNLDRQAWIKDESRTVSWKIDSIPPGEHATIWYQVVKTD